MEFKFNVNEVFKQPIVEINHTLIPPGFSGDRRALWDTVGKVSEIVNAMGEASAAAQGLTKPITTADRLRNSEHKLYFLVDQKANNGRGAITGMLKTGRKGLYVFDREGQHYQVTPACVLDFYVHESRQRSGFGKRLFEYMLEKENVHPMKMAVDRPSDKFLGFLNKHYGLNTPIKQMNNYVVFDGFFPNVPEKNSPAATENNNSNTPGKKQSANGLQTTAFNASPYGRYGAPRPPCSMGQIIHNQTSTIQKAQEPAGVYRNRSAPESNYQAYQQANPVSPNTVTQSVPNLNANQNFMNTGQNVPLETSNFYQQQGDNTYIQSKNMQQYGSIPQNVPSNNAQNSYEVTDMYKQSQLMNMQGTPNYQQTPQAVYQNAYNFTQGLPQMNVDVSSNQQFVTPRADTAEGSKSTPQVAGMASQPNQTTQAQQQRLQQEQQHLQHQQQVEQQRLHQLQQQQVQQQQLQQLQQQVQQQQQQIQQKQQQQLQQQQSQQQQQLQKQKQSYQQGVSQYNMSQQNTATTGYTNQSNAEQDLQKISDNQNADENKQKKVIRNGTQRADDEDIKKNMFFKSTLHPNEDHSLTVTVNTQMQENTTSPAKDSPNKTQNVINPQTVQLSPDEVQAYNSQYNRYNNNNMQTPQTAVPQTFQYPRYSGTQCNMASTNQVTAAQNYYGNTPMNIQGQNHIPQMNQYNQAAYTGQQNASIQQAGTPNVLQSPLQGQATPYQTIHSQNYPYQQNQMQVPPQGYASQPFLSHTQSQVPAAQAGRMSQEPLQSAETSNQYFARPTTQSSPNFTYQQQTAPNMLPPSVTNVPNAQYSPATPTNNLQYAQSAPSNMVPQTQPLAQQLASVNQPLISQSNISASQLAQTSLTPPVTYPSQTSAPVAAGAVSNLPVAGNYPNISQYSASASNIATAQAYMNPSQSYSLPNVPVNAQYPIDQMKQMAYQNTYPEGMNINVTEKVMPVGEVKYASYDTSPAAARHMSYAEKPFTNTGGLENEVNEKRNVQKLEAEVEDLKYGYPPQVKTQAPRPIKPRYPLFSVTNRR